MTRDKIIPIVLAIMLCIGTPVVSLGPSFIVWPSPSEIAGLLMIFIAFTDAKYHQKIPGNVKILLQLTFSYVLVITLVGSIFLANPIQYPGWAIFRFIEWFLLLPWILFSANKVWMGNFGIGLLFGGLINVITIILEFLDMSPRGLIIDTLDAANAGPWGKFANEEITLLMYGASGMFSFSRTATGFLLGIISALSYRQVESRMKNVAFQIVLLIGIIGTGSRLGFLTWLAVNIFGAAKDQRITIKNVALIFGILLTVFIVYYLAVSEDFLLAGRFFGVGEDNYSTGLDGRSERQLLIFELSLLQLIFGVGAGNLGFALGLNEVGLNFYGAHGFVFQYIASIGLIGTTFLLSSVLMVLRYFRFTAYSIPLCIGFFLCSVSDDFFFPTAQGMHLPLIFAATFRLCAMRVLRFAH